MDAAKTVIPDLEALWMPFTANRQFKARPRLLAMMEPGSVAVIGTAPEATRKPTPSTTLVQKLSKTA